MPNWEQWEVSCTNPSHMPLLNCNARRELSNPLYITFYDLLLHNLTSIPQNLKNPHPNIAEMTLTNEDDICTYMAFYVLSPNRCEDCENIERSNIWR